ncbi:MAG TPA: hypothetical protein VKC60_06220 [Opitutaceae bacterium]|nr:hypothetical protein [Opitutaceae bacterium]
MKNKFFGDYWSFCSGKRQAADLQLIVQATVTALKNTEDDAAERIANSAVRAL